MQYESVIALRPGQIHPNMRLAQLVAIACDQLEKNIMAGLAAEGYGKYDVLEVHITHSLLHNPMEPPFKFHAIATVITPRLPKDL